MWSLLSQCMGLFCGHFYPSDCIRGMRAMQCKLMFLIALIWAIHPLQTASVTYVVQRCESMMGMFFLLALYCVIRSDDSYDSSAWHWSAIGFCALGNGLQASQLLRHRR